MLIHKPDLRWQSLDSESDESQLTAATEWVVANRLNAITGQKFVSWAEYFGPVLDRDDRFSHKVSEKTLCYAIEKLTFR